MLEGIVLGIIQGVTEWLPISSEGMLVLAQVHIFGEVSASGAIELALFLHLGTFFSALVYFRKEVWRLLGVLFTYKTAGEIDKKVIRFLLFTTLISGALALVLLGLVERFEELGLLSGKILTGSIGAVLLITALMLFLGRKYVDNKGRERLNIVDTVLLGIGQGFSAIPGVSRSGTTVSLLLLRKFREDEALRLSFLMSLPIVLAGNIVLQIKSFDISLVAIVGLIAAFISGFFTIDLLLRLTKRINFALFVLLFGILTILSVFV